MRSALFDNRGLFSSSVPQAKKTQATVEEAFEAAEGAQQ